MNAPIDVWLIHGLGDSPRVWRRVGNDRALRRYRLFAPALPGFGGVAPLAARQRGVQGLATWLTTQIARRSRGRRVIIIGHSMGGMLATLVASSHAGILGIVNVEGPLTLHDCDTTRRASNAADFQAWFRAFRQAVRLPESGAPPHYAASVAEADPRTFLACARDIVSLARRAGMGTLRRPARTSHLFLWKRDGRPLHRLEALACRPRPLARALRQSRPLAHERDARRIREDSWPIASSPRSWLSSLITSAE